MQVSLNSVLFPMMVSLKCFSLAEIPVLAPAAVSFLRRRLAGNVVSQQVRPTSMPYLALPMGVFNRSV